MTEEHPSAPQDRLVAAYEELLKRTHEAMTHARQETAPVLRELLDKANIQERLTMRNFMEGLRNSGVETGGPAALSAGDRQAFANQLDRLLARRK